MKLNKAIFILTYGRPKKQTTFNTLKRCKCQYPIYFICSDDDKSLDELKSKFGEKRVLVFNKKEVAKDLDLMTNNPLWNVILYARNYCFKVASDLGIDGFIQLDDDYTGFYYADFKNKKWRELKKIDAIFDLMFDFYRENKRLLGFSLSQGGDFIGGLTKDKMRVKRKAMNSFFCLTERKFKFRGVLNEDVNFYVGEGARDGICFQTHYLKLIQGTTQKNKGGMTGAYIDGGTYAKSFYSVMINPSAVSISEMGMVFKRLHHKINYDLLCPKIIRECYGIR